MKRAIWHNWKQWICLSMIIVLPLSCNYGKKILVSNLFVMFLFQVPSSSPSSSLNSVFSPSSCGRTQHCPPGHCCVTRGLWSACVPHAQEGDLCINPHLKSSASLRTTSVCGCAPGLRCDMVKNYEFGICTAPFKYRWMDWVTVED